MMNHRNGENLPFDAFSSNTSGGGACTSSDSGALPKNSMVQNSGATTTPEGMTRLPSGFQPGPWDVICARGKHAYNHVGNKRLRAMIDFHLDMYSKASNRLEKSAIVSTIVDTVRRESPDGGFIKEIDGTWYEVGDHICREKIGQNFRDLLHTQYKSSTKAKRRRRTLRDQQGKSNPANNDNNQKQQQQQQHHHHNGVVRPRPVSTTKAADLAADIWNHCLVEVDLEHQMSSSDVSVDSTSSYNAEEDQQDIIGSAIEPIPFKDAMAIQEDHNLLALLSFPLDLRQF